MIGRDIPEIRAIASTYLPSDSKLPYVQEFGVADDGIVEAPRIVSGGMVGDYMRLAAESELNMHFVSTHFMHPDDMLDPDRGAKEGWRSTEKALRTISTGLKRPHRPSACRQARNARPRCNASLD